MTFRHIQMCTTFKTEAVPGFRFLASYSLWANIELTLLKNALERSQDAPARTISTAWNMVPQILGND